MITDLEKYKRLFAFGCSFTSYMWPTWADIMYKSMKPESEFYNFAKSGGGNVFIANRITEANRKYKFTETDLIIVMWTTNARIDFYKTEDGGWRTPGNIYTQNILSQKIVAELEDLNWFLIRDLSIIDLTTSYLNNLKCDVFKFTATPYYYDIFRNSARRFKEDKLTNSIIETYSDLKNGYPISLYEFMHHKWSTKIKYKNSQEPDSAGLFTDYHPTPVDYANYLIKCNIPITQKSIDYAQESLDKMLVLNISSIDITNMFPDCNDRITKSFTQLW